MWQVYLLGQGHQQVRDARHRLSGLVHLAHEVLHTAGIFLGFVIDPAGDALHDPGGSLVSDNSGKERDLLLVIRFNDMEIISTVPNELHRALITSLIKDQSRNGDGVHGVGGAVWDI